MTAPLFRFLIRRLAAAILLVAIVSCGTLVLGHFAPGASTSGTFAAGDEARAIALERARAGLDRPLAAQLVAWLSGLVRFDLGSSVIYGRPVSELVAERALNTAELAAFALLLALGIGIPVGLFTGGRPRHPLTRVLRPISIAIVSCHPVIAALALSLLAIRTGWLSIAPGALALPVLALGLPFAAMLERLQARATSDALALPSLVAAAARGIPPRRLLWVHAGRQSLQPVLGILGVVIGALFGGSLAVEYITAWPGLGRLMYDALVGRDLFLVAGCALAGSVVLAAGNFAADVLRALADPRVREPWADRLA